PASPLFPYTTLFRSFWSPASSTFSVGVFLNPGAPAILTVSTPAPTKGSSSVTLTGTGVAGQTITRPAAGDCVAVRTCVSIHSDRSEEHTSELQSRGH